MSARLIELSVSLGEMICTKHSKDARHRVSFVDLAH